MRQILVPSELEVWSQRLWAAILLGGRTAYYIWTGKIDRSKTAEQMLFVGPGSLLIVLLTAILIGMVFTIQVAQEFINIGATSIVGGILALALSRELAPLLTAVVVAGRVGAAFAATIGTMKVTEQVDALYVLKTSPVEYLVVPRVIACGVMVPALTILALLTGILGGLMVAQISYGLTATLFLQSIQTLMTVWDLSSSVIKAVVFGVLIGVIGCNWGLTTSGGARGVGLSTTAAVVTSLLAIFFFDFFLSWLMFRGSTAALQAI